jgi:hypothetical protein
MPQTHFEGCKDRQRILQYKTLSKKVLFLNKLMFMGNVDPMFDFEFWILN